MSTSTLGWYSRVRNAEQGDWYTHW